MTTVGGLPAYSTGGSSAGTGGVNVPNPIHLPPVAGVPPGPATTQQSRAFAGAGTLRQAGLAAAVAQTSLVSAAGKYIPVTYGNCRWSGLCYFFETHQTTGAVVIGLLLGEGEIGGVIDVEINNAPLRGGCSYTAYTGTAGQAADPTIAALLAARVPAATYTETLAGLAHVVITLGATAYAPSEIRGIDVSHLGKKLFDPRDGTQSKTNPATWKYNANAGLVLGDFETSGYAIARGVMPRYGRRCNVIDASVTAVANLSDELIGNAPYQRKRSEIHAVLLNPTANETWEQTFRTHARCFVDRLGDTVELIPDVARSPVMTLDDSQIIKYERVSERLVGAAPTMMEATFTDTSVKPWRQRTVRLYDPRVLTGEIPEVPGQVDLRMCQSYTQVMALLRFRLNQTALSVRAWGVSLGAEGYARQKGDVLSVTHPLGMTNKAWTVDTVTDRGFGEVHLKLSEYDAGAYLDVIQTTPATLGNGVANCLSVPNITSLSAVQQSVNELQTGGGYACILRINGAWDAVSFPCLAYYEVQLLSGATVIATANVGTNSWQSAPMTAGTYTLKVRCVSGLAGQSPGAWASTSVTVAAATCPPVPTTSVRVRGTHARVVGVDSGTFISVYSDRFERVITCDAPATTVTRTELWFAWGSNPTFAGATKVRDDAGAQTTWTFLRAWYDGWGVSEKHYCLVALGTSPAAPTSGFSSPGSSPAGSYANALSSYSGPGLNWYPPTKAWVRWNNAGVFSDPVEVVLSQTQLTYPDAVAGLDEGVGWMFDGSGLARVDTPFSGTFNGGLSEPFPVVNPLVGLIGYAYAGGSNHTVTGRRFDDFGEPINGYVQWQAWKV